MPDNAQGYEGLLYYGAAGAQAGTQITDRVDVEYEVDPEIGSTTAAGDGSKVPINTGEATALGVNMTWNMIVNKNSTAIVDLLAAAATGAAIAIRYIRASGKLGLDADVILGAKQGAPLKGEQTIDFTVKALSRSQREPKLND